MFEQESPSRTFASLLKVTSAHYILVVSIHASIHTQFKIIDKYGTSETYVVQCSTPLIESYNLDTGVLTISHQALGDDNPRQAERAIAGLVDRGGCTDERDVEVSSVGADGEVDEDVWCGEMVEGEV